MTWVNSDHYVYFKIQRLIPTLNFHTGFVKPDNETDKRHKLTSDLIPFMLRCNDSTPFKCHDPSTECFASL